MSIKMLFYILAIIVIFPRENHLQAQTKEFEIHLYNGIPGCQCFLHCTCYSDLPGAKIQSFQNPSSWHPDRTRTPADDVWHQFIYNVHDMQHTGGYFCGSSLYPYTFRNCYTRETLLQCFEYHEMRDCCLLSDYLNNLEVFSQNVEDTKNYCLFCHSKWKEENRTDISLDDQIVEQRAKKVQERIANLREDIIFKYKLILIGCPHNEHPENLASIYNKGLLSMQYGDMDDCLKNIKKFIKFCKANHRVDLLTSGVYQNKGDAYFAVGLYNKAIKAVSKAIEINPDNRKAYFSRAQAYFESGDFDRAIEDYLASDKSKLLSNVKLLTSLEFHNALLKGTYEGVQEAAKDFFPSLYHSAHGLGESLWVFVNHPLDSTKQFANACQDLTIAFVAEVRMIAKYDKEKFNKIAVELQELYEKFDKLSDAEKGGLIVKAIGKYGTDIFLTGKTKVLKSLAVARKTKEANALCNLEAMAKSRTNKEVIVAKVAERQAQKETVRKGLKIEHDKQNKHVVRKHNYETGRNRSIFEHPDPQGLVDKFCGKGRPIGKATSGSPGYQEVVNFREFIGYDVNKNTGEKIPTTWGKIHYSKNGVHIVPTNPRENE